MKQITLLITAMFYGCFASAADGDVLKQTVDGLQWTYTILSEADKTCYIGGGKEIDYWGELSIVPAIDKNTTGAITIPTTLNGYSVIAIGERAFRNVNISSVVIPYNVTRIEKKAFGGSENLTSVTLPEGLIFIGEEAFQECI